jgi:hypothetical protein
MPDQQNRQTKFLAGLDLDHAGFIGTSEHYDEALRELSDFLGRPIENVRTNEAPKHQTVELDASERTEIERLNAQDIALYERVLGRKPTRPATPAVRGNAQRLSADLIKGWAVAENEKTIARLSMEIDGQPVRQDNILCDIYRTDLVKAGITSNGVGGFEISLSDYPVDTAAPIRFFSKNWEITI